MNEFMKNLFSEAAEYPLSRMDIARIIAQTHDAMQAGQPSVCPFLYDEHAHVWCDGEELTIEQFMNKPNIWGWLMAANPEKVTNAVIAIRDSKIDGLCQRGMTVLLIVTLFNQLSDEELSNNCKF